MNLKNRVQSLGSHLFHQTPRSVRPGARRLFGRGPRTVGQSMLEFALALPILLILIFGIIEFARLLQAWLALENGARFAVRYAVTGSYDVKYCAEAAAALEHETQYPATYVDNAGVTRTINKTYSELDMLDGAANCRIPQDVDGHRLSNQDDVMGALQDWARMPSIRDVALSGAMGIAINTNPTITGSYTDFLSQAYQTASFDKTYRGNPGAPGYFGISMCSTRVLPPDGDGFQFNANKEYYPTIPAGENPGEYEYPIYCQFVKAADPNKGSVIRYIDDAGGPGDRMRVVLTYRHTLITPFLSSWWESLRLSSEREGVVEKFRTSRVTGLTGAVSIAATYTHTPLPDTQTPTVTLTPTPQFCDNTGSILWEWWEGLNSGNYVDDLTNPSKNIYYPDSPNGWDDQLTMFEIPSSYRGADRYGTRFRGFVCPPVTGDYVFYISSDDNSSLMLSTDPNPSGRPANTTEIAFIKSVSGDNGWTNSREWNKYPNAKNPSRQASDPIHLEGGTFYYIETLHKEGTGGDNMAVGWVGPYVSNGNVEVITGQYLKPLQVSHAPTRTPTPTQTFTPTPVASCDDLEFVGSPGYPSELMDIGGRGIWVYMDNNSTYPIYLLGNDGTWDGDWHSDSTYEPDIRLDNWIQDYRWYNGGYSTIYSYYHRNNSDTRRIKFQTPSTNWSIDFPNPWKIDPGTVGGQFLAYTTRNFYQALAVSGNSTNMNYYHGSDVTMTIRYRVGDSLLCSKTVTGVDGPQITPLFSASNSVISGEVQITSLHAPAGYDVIFTVYDSSGTQVHRSTDNTPRYCLFGNSGSNCRTKQVLVDTWSSGALITNQTYTISIAVAEKDDTKYSTRIDTTLRITGVNTPTRTLTRTITNTPRPSNTAAPSRTPTVSGTPTKTGTTTKTPTVTNTRLPTNTPTKTKTRTPTVEPTQCQIPAEQGGCQ